jgi:hypothetical protein
MAVTVSGCATKEVKQAPASTAALPPGQNGLQGMDPKWTRYERYLTAMIEKVQKRWEQNIEKNKAYPKSGTHAEIVFILNAGGAVARIVEVQGDAGDGGLRACVAAVTDLAPYGAWTPEMIEVLGREQKMTFNFYYQ